MPKFEPLWITVTLRDAVTGEIQNVHKVDYNKDDARSWLTNKVLIWAMFHNIKVELEAAK